MATWHGYFVVERLNIGAGNWTALRALFEAMGMSDSIFPAHNNHWRTRADGDAVIYESLFDPSEVSIAAFRQLLADEFGVSVENIMHETDSADYTGVGTTIWTFYYPTIAAGRDRFEVEKFGGDGSSWGQSGQETHGYLAANAAAWGNG